MRFNKAIITSAAVLSITVASACSDDDSGITGTGGNKSYTQIERLGNPLVSEVFFPKRDHGLHNTKGPDVDSKLMTDGGTDVPGHVRSFLAQFGRSEKIITTI